MGGSRAQSALCGIKPISGLGGQEFRSQHELIYYAKCDAAREVKVGNQPDVIRHKPVPPASCCILPKNQSDC